MCWHACTCWDTFLPNWRTAHSPKLLAFASTIDCGFPLTIEKPEIAPALSQSYACIQLVPCFKACMRLSSMSCACLMLVWCL